MTTHVPVNEPVRLAQAERYGWRHALSDVLFVIAATAVAGGVSMIDVPAGVIVAGVELGVAAWALGAR